jgi:hypothetical protein
MKNVIKSGFLALALLALNSCYINRSTVGDGPTGKSGTVKYSHAKQVYLFWGAIACGHPAPATPSACGYQIKTAFNTTDMLINLITGGIVGTRNIKILVNKNSQCDPAIQKFERKVEKSKLKKELKNNSK